MQGSSALVLATLLCGAALPAQIIVPKTVPIAQGDQFNFFPSVNGGMAGITIAIDDSLLDPFSNPARVTGIREARLFGAPTFYNISGEAGAGRTLPIGTAGRVGNWGMAVTAALQQVDKGNRQGGSPDLISGRSGMNQFLSVVLGREFAAQGLSVGSSLYWSGLDAVDGVDLLYGGASSIEQFGSMIDLRLGMTKRWKNDRTFDAVLLFDRFDMTHDVVYEQWNWLPRPGGGTPVVTRREEHNQDRTITWGAHLEYERPLTARGWRIGWMATGNKLQHPKIPNYELQNIPRDPGQTKALNLGVGVSRTHGAATFGIDVIYEPMWSETWADAARDTAILGPQGQPVGIIRAGAKTVENQFDFSNAIVRMGLGRETVFGGSADPKTLGLQLGVAMHAINYRLRQQNHVMASRRTQNEDWVEWTPTAGLTLRFPELEIRYTTRYTMGVGRPATFWGFAVDAAASGTPRAGGIIAAPAAPLQLQDVHVVNHQIAFSLPIR